MGASKRGEGGGSLASTVTILFVVGAIVAGGIFVLWKSEKEERRLEEAREKLIGRKWR
jgi:hypothetical protein